jgi:hypothetical protein
MVDRSKNYRQKRILERFNQCSDSPKDVKYRVFLQRLLYIFVFPEIFYTLHTPLRYHKFFFAPVFGEAYYSCNVINAKSRQKRTPIKIFLKKQPLAFSRIERGLGQIRPQYGSAYAWPQRRRRQNIRRRSQIWFVDFATRRQFFRFNLQRPSNNDYSTLHPKLSEF